MTSSTDETRVLRDGHGGIAPLPMPELREGSWTRYGGSGLLGDRVTEQALGAIADRAADAARASGYAVGWAQGVREAAEESARTAAAVARAAADAEERRARDHQEAMSALTRAVAGLEDVASAVAAALERQALRLARELTEALVGHALETSPDPAGDVVARVLAVLPDTVPVTVRVAPAVAALSEAWSPVVGRVQVVADPGVAPHDAIVETDDTTIEVSVTQALARVREALS